MKKYILKLKLAFVACFLVFAAFSQYNPEDKWGESIAKFEQQDSVSMPEPGGILFLGSSSFTIWKDVSDYFPGKNIVNRGFGGSEMSDLLHFKEKLILPYQPKQIVVYVGENDIAAGEAPESVFEEGKQLVNWTKGQFPEVQFLFLSAKPSPRRWELRDKMQDLNLMLSEFASENEAVEHANIWSMMLGENGKPKPEIFLKDSLHMNANGYKIWQKVLTPYLK
jgi:lysophospholipase L1-like esterase